MCAVPPGTSLLAESDGDATIKPVVVVLGNTVYYYSYSYMEEYVDE
jgi:hypothetical protein